MKPTSSSIRDHFGSRRGLARFILYQLSSRFWSRRLSPAELERVTRLVFVCRGNICRSAMAECVAHALGFPARSYGTHTHLGKPANPGIVEAAATHGFDLSTHMTTPLEHYCWSPGDLVLVFEPAHLRELKSNVGKDCKYALIGDWGIPRRPYIHDPFGGTPGYHDRVAQRIQGAVENLVAEIGGQNA